MADKDDKKQDKTETKTPERSKKVESSKKDGFEHLKVPGSALDVKRVDTEDKSFRHDQNEALLKYRVTGVVGTYIDPLRDQEPDIAPEFGVAPHPELHNPAPPESSVGANPASSKLVDSVEDKVKADDPSVAQGLSSDTQTATSGNLR